MALNEKRSWLIAYDIAEPGRLNRVHRYLKSQAIPVQYSVFVASTTANGIRRIRDALAHKINPREDDVRIYLLPQPLSFSYLGRPPLPQGLLLPNLAPLA